MSREEVPAPSAGRCAGKAAVLAVPAGVVICLLFALVGHSTLIGVLAGCCVLAGTFLCAFAWSYLKEAERWAKAHPAPKPEETDEAAAEETTE